MSVYVIVTKIHLVISWLLHKI